MCVRNLADIDGDGRLVPDEFIVALHYVAIAKSGKPVPATLPPDIVPPSYRKQQKPPTSESPAEKQPPSLPRPTSRPPAGVTKVPAIQPPASSAAKSQPQAAASSTEPAAFAGSVDPFGMKPAVFESTAAAAGAPAADAEKETSAAVEDSVPAEASAPPTTGVPPTEPSSSTVQPSSVVENEGMLTAVLLAKVTKYKNATKTLFIGLDVVSCVLICLVTLGIVLGLVDFHFLLSILCVLLILSSLIRTTISVFFVPCCPVLLSFYLVLSYMFELNK